MASKRDPNVDLVEIGYVARAHGIRGEVFAACHNPESTTLEVAPVVWLDGVRFTITARRPMKDGFILVLEGVVDRNRAETLRGKRLEVERNDILLEDGEQLLQDLIGYQVQLADGTPWGTVVGLDLGPQDRLVIHHERMERLLPVVDAFLAKVDAAAKLITVTPPEDFPESPVGDSVE